MAVFFFCSFDDCEDIFPLIEKHCVKFPTDAPKDIDPTFLPKFATEVSIYHYV